MAFSSEGHQALREKKTKLFPAFISLNLIISYVGGNVFREIEYANEIDISTQQLFNKNRNFSLNVLSMKLKLNLSGNINNN